ncbi:MAG: hypothetical protein ACRDHD_12750, partial [Candidatus Limnocylindria bacterium]
LVATRDGSGGGGGRLAPPVLVERSHFAVVESPGGDIGLRQVLNDHPEWVLAVEVEKELPDVDTAADLETLRDG